MIMIEMPVKMHKYISGIVILNYMYMDMEFQSIIVNNVYCYLHRLIFQFSYFLYLQKKVTLSKRELIELAAEKDVLPPDTDPKSPNLNFSL